MDISKIEDRIDRVAAGATEIDMRLGGVTFKTMTELMEFAKLMSVSGAAVPQHLRGNPGACLAICTRALRFGFDPFSLAEHSYAMKKFDVETIAYDSFVIRAIVQAWAPVTSIVYSYEGEGDERVCIAVANLKDKSTLVHRSPTLGALKAMRGRNKDGVIKGSPLWDSAKADQQMAYDTGRDLCRRYFPEVLLGWYDRDEFDERAVQAKDITPAKPDVAARLKGSKGRGFNPEHIARETQTAPDGPPDGRPDAFRKGHDAFLAGLPITSDFTDPALADAYADGWRAASKDQPVEAETVEAA